jgi:hypothetical protein
MDLRASERQDVRRGEKEIKHDGGERDGGKGRIPRGV